MIDLTTTNVLLGIVAAVAVLQMIGIIVIVVVAARAYRHVLERVDEVEQALTPVVARAQVLIDRVDRVSARVDEGTERLESALAVTARGAELAMTTVNGNVKRTAAFVAAVATGGRAALHAWRASAGRRRRRSHELPSLPPVNANLDPTEEHHVPIRG